VSVGASVQGGAAGPVRRLLAAVGTAVLLVSLTAGLVDAGAGTLTIDPTTVARGATLTISGCGYPVPTSISFHVVGPSVDYFTAGEPLDATSGGCFSETWTAWWSKAGAYSITSYYRDTKGSTRKVAVVKFTVT
jgi:hypothetical protein